MGLTRLSSAAKTLSIASAILLIDSILSAWAFHTLPSAWPRRESRGMTAAPIVTSRNYQFISNVNCCRSLTRSTVKNPAFSACDLLLQCCGSSSLSPRPPRILPPTAYSPFVGGWASASSVRRPGWRKPRERSGGALCMVDSGGGKREPARNRALGSVVYLLPLLDGIDCGENVFRVWPEFGNLLHLLLGPALAVWQHVPFMPLVMFVILQISVRRQDTSRFVRFNVQQAILVDILTVVLGLLGTAVGYFNPEGEQFMTNFAFYCLAGAVVYAVSETARGRVANQIPLISAAAEIQIGP